jgi:hypothetical protein
MRLRYRATDYWTQEQNDVVETVRLAISRPRFGGVRWLFICPCSNRRVRKLYLPFGARRFASRRYHRLAYRSQRASWYDRAIDQAFKIRRRLGNAGAVGDPFPVRPKGMHRATYDCLIERLAKNEGLCDDRACMLVAGLMRRAA